MAAGDTTACSTPIWLITHQELSSAARIKVFMQAFAPAVENVLKAGSSTHKNAFLLIHG